MVEKARRNRFAQNLKAQRAKAGLNQLALAKLLGIAQPAVARYETGIREPDLDDLMTIAEKLNTTPNDLLGFGFPAATAKPAPLREIKAGAIKTGDNSPVVLGDGNTVVSPPKSTSTSRSTARKSKPRK